MGRDAIQMASDENMGIRMEVFPCDPDWALKESNKRLFEQLAGLSRV